MTFTQNAADFARPGAGVNIWNEADTTPVVGPRYDAYHRFLWTDFQPFNGAANSYSFTAFDLRVNNAISAGQKLSFGIMQQCGGCDAQYQNTVGGSKTILPLYLHTQMQAESVKDWSDGSSWIPNYNSPSYINAWKNLNVAINAHIVANGWEKYISTIDVRGYGDYGEWTNNQFSGPTGSTATATSLQAIIDGVVKSYPNIQCVGLIAMFDAGYLASNTNVPAAVGYYALTTSNNAGKLGWRRDNWGWTDSYISHWLELNSAVYNGLTFSTEIMNRYKLAPVIGEPADLGAAGHFEALPTQVNLYHASSFGNGNLNGEAGNSTTNANFALASKAAGYRLSVTGGSLTSTAGLQTSLTWSNTGVAPTYENWNVVFQLRAGTTIKWSGVSTFKPKLFLPGSTVINDSFTDTPAGTFDLYVLVQDPTGVRLPMPLALTSPSRGADGSYLLQAAVVLGTGGTPPPPAPPPQTTFNVFTTQTPPTNVQNDGQASTGIAVGMRFKANTTGSITGVRFYKPTGLTGTKTGQLYDLAGNLLASVVFTGETSSGWQTMSFANPVGILANTVYVVAVHNSLGNYISSGQFFKGVSVVNGPLTALADGTNGGTGTDTGKVASGLYAYSATAVNPTSIYQAGNYWVDVVFSTASTNILPVAVITGTADITITKGSTTLSGTSSTDADGTIASYLWTKVSGPTGDTIVSPTASSTVISGLTIGTYVYNLKVTDDRGGVANTTRTVTVHF